MEKFHNTSSNINTPEPTLFEPWIGLTNSNFFLAIVSLGFKVLGRFWVFFFIFWECMEALDWRKMKVYGYLRIFLVFFIKKMVIFLSLHFGFFFIWAHEVFIEEWLGDQVWKIMARVFEERAIWNFYKNEIFCGFVSFLSCL